jgi:uncharacterized membrane-anchored protein YhcB (DUF1043 family)
MINVIIGLVIGIVLLFVVIIMQLLTNAKQAGVVQALQSLLDGQAILIKSQLQLIKGFREAIEEVNKGTKKRRK